MTIPTVSCCIALFANVVQYLPSFDLPVQPASPVPTAIASAPKDDRPENPAVRCGGEDRTVRHLWVVTMHVHLQPTVGMIATAILVASHRFIRPCARYACACCTEGSEAQTEAPETSTGGRRNGRSWGEGYLCAPFAQIECDGHREPYRLPTDIFSSLTCG